MSKKLFYLLLILLPINLAKHFIFPWCYVNGILVDYLIPTVYVTDIAIWALLFSWLLETISNIKDQRSNIPRNKSRFARFKLGWQIKNQKLRGLLRSSPLIYLNTYIPIYLLLLFLVALGPSVFLAKNQPAAVYRFLKVAEYVLFALFVAKNIDLRNDFEKIIKALSVGVAFESLLVIGQWLKQSSLFGYLFFGEPIFNSSMFGIAKTEVLGLTKIRPYGTFPHPNVLGGYLAILLPWMLMGVIREMRGIRGVIGIRERGLWWWILVVGLGTIGIFLSFSRAAWVVGGLGMAVVLARSLRRDGVYPVSTRALAILPALGLLVGSLIVSRPSLSVSRRLSLSGDAIAMISKSPLFGVGLNNFTIALPKFQQTLPSSTQFLQPVHNVLLLIVAECGVSSMVLFCFFVAYLISKLKDQRSKLQIKEQRWISFSLTFAIFQICLLCLIDHYFWTIQQTSLLLWLILGMIIAYVKLKSEIYAQA